MKGLILTALGSVAATAGVGYVAVEKPREALITGLRADNAQLAAKLNTRTAGIDAAIKVLQDARK